MASKKLVIDLDPQGPITFTRAIKIPTGDGKPLTVEFDFMFRDRVAMAELLQKWDAQVEKSREQVKAMVDAQTINEPAVGQERPDLKAATIEGIASDVDTMMDFIVGWQLSAEFTRENLSKFITRYPGAPLTLVRDYREGMTQGRLGN